MKTRILSISTLLALGLLIFSCGTKEPDQMNSLDVDAIHTDAVATFASSLTETLAALSTPSLTPGVDSSITPTALTSTLEPSPTTNPCYNLLYRADVTIPDETRMKAGEVFTKTWEVQNIGGCAWRPGFTFRHYGGDRMRGNPITLTEAVPTGAIRTLSVELVVPGGVNGLIQSSWRMTDEYGVFFGDTLTVNILVGEIATSTP